MARPLDVLGTQEVAQLAQVDPVTVWRWRQTGLEPDAVLATGPVWRRSTVLRWLRRTGRTQPETAA